MRNANREKQNADIKMLVIVKFFVGLWNINFLLQGSEKCRKFRDIPTTVTLMYAFTDKMIYKEKIIDFLVSTENSCIENNLDFFSIVNAEKICLLKKCCTKYSFFFVFLLICLKNVYPYLNKNNYPYFIYIR